jgi:iron complex outermembrane receptor protein
MLAAPAAAQAHTFQIAAGDMKTALDVFARQSGSQIIYPIDKVQGVRSNGVAGAMSPDAALDALLAGSGLHKKRDATGAVLIMPSGKSGLNKLAYQDATPTPFPASTAPERESAPSAAPAVEDIVVMARKRAESIQDVPVSITAVGAAQIERNNVVRLHDIASFSPNVTLNAPTISPTNIAPFIRGIGSRSNDPSQDVPIAISIDGVYLNQIAGSMVDVFDVQQIEILRGPQGTLQGRNSPGGAINITTRRPTQEFTARGEISYGSYNAFTVRGSVSGAIVPEKLAVRASVYHNGGGGYLKSLTTGQHFGGQKATGGRLGLLFTPTEDISLYLTADYVRDRSPQPAIRPVPVRQAFPRQPIPVVCATFGFCTPYPEYRNGSGPVPNGSSKNGGFGSVLDIDMGPAKLTSVTGYRYVNEHTTADIDGLAPAIISLDDRTLFSRMFSQEVRLASNTDSPLEYVVGAYYMRSRFNVAEPVTFNGRTSTGRRRQVAKSLAVFGQATYHITDALSASAGIRQTWDDKVLDTRPAGITVARHFTDDWKNLSLEGGLEYKFNHDTLAYFRFAEGYRSGGINAGVAAIATLDAYDPETVKSYEVGLKSELFDRRLVLNASAFQSDYKDLQANVTISAGVRPVRNAASARIKGLELESVAKFIPNLTVSTAIGYLDPQYKKFFADLVGTGVITDNSFLTFPYTSKWTASVRTDYNIPLGDKGDVTLAMDMNYRSSANYSSVIQIQVGQQKSYALLNGSITYTAANEKYKISVYGRNLTDKYYINTGDNANGVYAWHIVGAPRTFGVRLSVEY